MVQTIVTPVDDVTFTASFQVVTGLEYAPSGDMVSFFPNPVVGENLSVRIKTDYDQEVTSFDGFLNNGRRRQKQQRPMTPEGQSCAFPLARVFFGVQHAGEAGDGE